MMFALSKVFKPNTQVLWQHHYIELKYSTCFVHNFAFSHNLTSHIWYYRKCWDVYWNLKWSSVGLNKHRLHSRSLYWPKPIAGFKRWSMNTTTRGRLCCFFTENPAGPNPGPGQQLIDVLSIFNELYNGCTFSLQCFSEYFQNSHHIFF